MKITRCLLDHIVEKNRRVVRREKENVAIIYVKLLKTKDREIVKTTCTFVHISR